MHNNCNNKIIVESEKWKDFAFKDTIIIGKEDVNWEWKIICWEPWEHDSQSLNREQWKQHIGSFKRVWTWT